MDAGRNSDSDMNLSTHTPTIIRHLSLVRIFFESIIILLPKGCRMQ